MDIEEDLGECEMRVVVDESEGVEGRDEALATPHPASTSQQPAAEHFHPYFSVENYQGIGYTDSGPSEVLSRSIMEGMLAEEGESGGGGWGSGAGVAGSEDGSSLPQQSQHDIISSLASYTTGDFAEQDQSTADANQPEATDVEMALVLNRVYQDNLARLVTEVESKLSEVRAKLEKMEQTRVGTSDGGRMKKKVTKVPALVYIHPYFKDSAGMAPPRNQESQMKVDYGEFNALIQPNRAWSKKDCDMLRAAVKREAIRLAVGSYERRKELVNEKIAAATEDAEPARVAMLENEKAELEKMAEDARMNVDLSAIPENDVNWLEISASNMGGQRTPAECKLKWVNELSPKFAPANKKWTGEELKKLADLVERRKQNGGDVSWADVARELGTKRTEFQCFEKYQSALNKDLVKEKWTEEEDEHLRHLVSVARTGDYVDWNQVTCLMEGRTRAQCQTRWERCLEPSMRKGRWGEDEDVLLMVAISKFGPKDWSKIADNVPGRNEAQCRDRWTSVLDTRIDKSSWTEAEDDTLMYARDKFCGRDGVVKWAKIAQLLPGRHSSACKTRYKSIEKTYRKQKLAEEKGGRKRKLSESGNEDNREEGKEGEEEEEEMEWATKKDPVRERRNRLQERRQRVHQYFEDLTKVPVASLSASSLEEGPVGPEEREAENEAKQEALLNTLPENLRREFRAKLAALRFRASRQKAINSVNVEIRHRVREENTVFRAEKSKKPETQMYKTPEEELEGLGRECAIGVRAIDRRIRKTARSENNKRKILREKIAEDEILKFIPLLNAEVRWSAMCLIRHTVFQRLKIRETGKTDLPPMRASIGGLMAMTDLAETRRRLEGFGAITPWKGNALAPPETTRLSELNETTKPLVKGFINKIEGKQAWKTAKLVFNAVYRMPAYLKAQEEKLMEERDSAESGEPADDPNEPGPCAK